MAHLTLIFKDITLQELPIETAEIGIGRAPDNAMRIDSLAVAPHHAVVRWSGDGATIAQLDPDYPLFVNEQPVGAHRLSDGDRITLGKHQILFKDDEGMIPAGITATEPKSPNPPREAVLQVLKGKSIGLVIPLRSNMTRLGKESSGIAMLARRKDGHYLSALSEPGAIRVNDETVDDRSVQLRHGDIVKVGDQLFQYFYH